MTYTQELARRLAVDVAKHAIEFIDKLIMAAPFYNTNDDAAWTKVVEARTALVGAIEIWRRNGNDEDDAAT